MAHPARPVSTIAVTMRTVWTLTTRSRLWPPTTAKPATVHSARSAPRPTERGSCVRAAEIGGEDLGQVAPLGQEDHQEHGDGDTPVRCHLPFDDGLVLALLDRLAQGQRSPDEEHDRHEDVEHPGRQEMEEGDPDRDHDHHVDREPGGRSDPHDARTSTRRHHERGEHGLVGELPKKDDREDGSDDVEVHQDLSVPVDGTLPHAVPALA